MKLSKAQQEVLDLMRNEWQLAYSAGFGSIRDRSWLQCGGIGRGGEQKKVHVNTVASLRNAGLIVIDNDGYPTRTFKLV